MHFKILLFYYVNGRMSINFNVLLKEHGRNREGVVGDCNASEIASDSTKSEGT